MKTLNLNGYKFNELNQTAKEKAIDFARYNDFYHYDIYCEEVANILKIIGFTIEENFAYSLNDRNSYFNAVGHYSYEKSFLQKIKKTYPNEKDLHEICQSLQDLQKNNKYSLVAYITRYNQYGYQSNIHSENENLTKIIKNIFTFCLLSLEQQEDYYNSDEAIIDFLENNDFIFLEDGSIFSK